MFTDMLCLLFKSFLFFNLILIALYSKLSKEKLSGYLKMLCFFYIDLTEYDKIKKKIETIQSFVIFLPSNISAIKLFIIQEGKNPFNQFLKPVLKY